MIALLSFILLLLSNFTAFVYPFGPNCLQFGDTCFTYYSSVLKWNDAYNYCKNAGGTLALPQEDEIWLQIYNKLIKGTTTHAWMGLTVNANSININQNAKIYPNSSFWANNGLTPTNRYVRCLLINYSNGQLFFNTGCDSYYNYGYPYLCQFSGCNKAKVNVTNTDYNICSKPEVVAVNTVLTVNCWKGFHKMPVTTQITCLGIGNWSQPNCTDVCQSPPPLRQHSTMVSPIKPIYDFNEKAVFICEDDYNTWERTTLRTHYKVSCLGEGVWSHEELDCVRTEEMVNVYFDQKTITLKCDSKLPSWRKWMKDGELIKSNGKYNILVTGNLEIVSPNDSDEGIYYCLRDHSVAKVFHVSKRSVCTTFAVSPVYYSYEKDEKDFLSLTCNLLDGQSSWLLDGKRVQMDADKSILDKGVLLLKTLKISDNGNFTCHCGNLTTAVHTVSVFPSSKNYCGNTGPASLVTLWHKQDSAPFCYGALIDSQWVITSAFCLFSFRFASDLDISVHFMGADLKQTNIMNASEIKIHPDYRPRLQAHDVALIKLKTFVRFSMNVNPACLAKIDIAERFSCQEVVTWDVKVIGFGSLDSFRNGGKVELLEENLIIDRSKDCLKDAKIVFNDDVFCATRNATIYPGDNGSPLIVKINGKSYLIGIYNVGNQANGLKSVDYFTDVVQYYDWIEAVTRYS